MTAALLETPAQTDTTARYARCIETSQRVRWDIERDVIRGRDFDYGKSFLPDGLSKAAELGFLQPAERRFLSQVQGRTYANMFALVERFIGAKTTELARSHGLGDQVAFEALVRLTDEELKHQALFRRLEAMMASAMPAGYRFLPQPDEVAQVVLSKSNWAVLALTLNIELFSQAHYRSSIDADTSLSELWRDVFRFHWIEESQHAVVDELEWQREHAQADTAARERGVDELIELVGAVDGIVQMQADADAEYFLQHLGRTLPAAETQAVRGTVLKAYRWQYIVSGAQEPRFIEALSSMVTEAQMQRIGAGLAPIVAHVLG
jgi:hypothetical protein